VVEKVEWVWAKPCDATVTSNITVTISATDADTPVEQLTYSDSGWVSGGPGCTDLTDAVTVISCEPHPGLRGTDAVVTDPQGNEGSLSFGFDPCLDGSICEGGAVCP
jgi:hypothetical protein